MASKTEFSIEHYHNGKLVGKEISLEEVRKQILERLKSQKSKKAG